MIQPSPSCGANARRTAAEVRAVCPRSEDLVLGKPRLDAARDDELHQLARQRALGAYERLGELLCDARPSLQLLAGPKVLASRPGEAAQVKSIVLKETRVFGRHGGAHERR